MFTSLENDKLLETLKVTNYIILCFNSQHWNRLSLISYEPAVLTALYIHCMYIRI